MISCKVCGHLDHLHYLDSTKDPDEMIQCRGCLSGICTPKRMVMTLRELLDQIAPDHQFTLWQENVDFRIPGLQLILRCSCGWDAQRLVTDREQFSEFSSIVTRYWKDWEQLQHLLDQEVMTL